MKGFTKRLLALIVCVVFMVTLFAACSSSAPTATPTAAAKTETKAAEAKAASADTSKDAGSGLTNPKGHPFKGTQDETYYMVVFVSGVEYWFPVYEMFKQCAWDLNVKSVYTGCPEYDVNKQVAAFEQVLAKKPAGMYLSPMNADAFNEPINKAIDSGVAVATFASDSPNSNRKVYITSNNVNEAAIACEAVAKAIGDEGEIAFTENPGQSNHDLYIKSFIADIEKGHPKIKIANRTATNQDTAKAYQAALSVLQAHPNLKAYITPEGPSAQGVAQALKEKNSKALLLTRDLNVDILNMIKEGRIWGAVDPDQGVQGYMGMLSLFLMKHNMVDSMTATKSLQIPYLDNGMNVVTKDTADSYYWDKYLKARGTKGIEE